MPTALELAREGWTPYLDAAKRRPAAPGLSSSEGFERERILERVRQAAFALKTRFGAKRVVLFGSFAHAAWFTADSDVDLAVCGLSGEDFWEAWRTAEEIIGDRPVDLVELETAGESLRRTVERYGKEL